MSHFTVMVIGANPKDQLKPFNENLEVEWKDQTEEFKLQYETEEVSEFYCESSSSWGFQITKELFDFIKSHKAGAIKKYVVEKQLMSYLTNGKKYRGYHTIEGGGRCDGDAWFEVVSINESNHPENNICFEGVVTIMVIDPPKEIKLKDKYPDYDTYLSDWHGIENKEKQGYWHNRNAKWDWYELGGRWTGFFKVKEGVFEITGNPGLMTKPAKDGYADVALKEEIDFEYMRNEAADKAAKKYEKAMAIFKPTNIQHFYFKNINN